MRSLYLKKQRFWPTMYLPEGLENTPFMKWGLKEGISIDADSGPPRYVLWCSGGICHQVLTFIQIGCGHTEQCYISIGLLQIQNEENVGEPFLRKQVWSLKFLFILVLQNHWRFLDFFMIFIILFKLLVTVYCLVFFSWFFYSNFSCLT